ncbi:MAG: hypothetical protein IJT77_04345, partial [Clostridia bacterium]|nr:hypothetical protein [Clostridia bacterium]
MESLLLAFPLPMLTVYILHTCGENLKSNGLLRTVLVLLVIYCVVLASAPFIGGFAYVTPGNQYSRGPLYPLLPLPSVAILLLTLAGVLRRRAQMSHKAFLRFIIALVPMTVALILQVFVDLL